MEVLGRDTEEPEDPIADPRGRRFRCCDAEVGKSEQPESADGEDLRQIALEPTDEDHTREGDEDGEDDVVLDPRPQSAVLTSVDCARTTTSDAVGGCVVAIDMSITVEAR